MGWKDWSYWLRGGMICFILVIPWIIYLINQYYNNNPLNKSFPIFDMIISLLGAVLFGAIMGLLIEKRIYILSGLLIGFVLTWIFINPLINILGQVCYENMGCVLIIPFGGFLGALIGFIVGKIKSKKQEEKA